MFLSILRIPIHVFPTRSWIWQHVIVLCYTSLHLFKAMIGLSTFFVFDTQKALSSQSDRRSICLRGDCGMLKQSLVKSCKSTTSWDFCLCDHRIIQLPPPKKRPGFVIVLGDVFGRVLGRFWRYCWRIWGEVFRTCVRTFWVDFGRFFR